jgi:LysR family transcriptional regulator, benzoate and cis,cis-muconate-responsive activator of ben and cat genes
MELRHLRYFAMVAEEQNITRAAQRLHVSQPPLSRQIRDLEDELGVMLLERSAKSVKLTDAGRVFLVEANAVLARAEQARQAVQAFATQCTGELHVGYAPSLTVELLPHALREFQKTSPHVRVTLHDFSTGEMLSGVRDGGLNLALMIQPGKAAMPGLSFEELRRYEMRVALPPSHPRAGEKHIPLEWLARQPLIGYTRADYPEYHAGLDALFAPLGGKRGPMEEHDGATSLIAAVESGRGLALVSQSFACFVGPRLKLLPIHPAPEPFSVGIVCRKAKLTATEAAFLQAARQPLPDRGTLE